MRYIYITLALAFTLAATDCPATETLQIFLAGDSTMSEKLPEKRPETGWGEALQDWFPAGKVLVVNHAKNGRSTRTFIKEGRWDALLAQVRPGDYILVQFAHNDQFPKKKPRRYAAPETFKANLARFVTDVRTKSATPVLLTPVVRRRFDENGAFYDTHGVYPELVREVAAQTETALIDLHARSASLVRGCGVERSKELFLWLEPGESVNYPEGREDDTHFSACGARAMASLVMQGIVESVPGLAEHAMKVPGDMQNAALLSPCCPGSTQAGPDEVLQIPGSLFDHSLPDTLGLENAPGAETTTVFRPNETDGTFNHGVVLMPFKGSLYAQWQNSRRDEDSPDTHVLYSVSADGKEWSRPRLLVSDPAIGAHSNGGWWTDGETLVAYIVRWRSAEQSVHSGLTEFITSKDGAKWTRPVPVRDQHGQAIDGVIEQDPHRLLDGRIISAFHEQPGLKLAPYYTDDPLGISGWTRGQMQNLPFKADTSRELEPSWFLRPDGSIVMIMRDQASSFRKLASLSTDRGVTWSKPRLSNVPDSRSKQSAGNLPDGTAYMVSNPTESKQRFPLVLMLSRDGKVFNRALLLRSGGADLQAMRFEGRYKRAGYSYPKSITWNGYLYVAYATNKEDAELTRIPLEGLSD